MSLTSAYTPGACFGLGLLTLLLIVGAIYALVELYALRRGRARMLLVGLMLASLICLAWSHVLVSRLWRERGWASVGLVVLVGRVHPAALTACASGNRALWWYDGRPLGAALRGGGTTG